MIKPDKKNIIAKVLIIVYPDFMSKNLLSYNHIYVLMLFLASLGLLTLKIFESDLHWISIPFFILLIYGSYIDLKHLIIPDTVSVGLLPVGAIYYLIYYPDQFVPHLAGAILAFISLILLARLFYLVRNFEGIGFGDIKLIASAVMWIGMTNLPSVILLASLSGILASLGHIRHKTAAASSARIPFGPHLSAAIWCVWIWAAQKP